MIKYHDSRKSVDDYFKWRTVRVKPVIQRINQIKKLKGLRILEVGCGYGSLLSLLADFKANAIGVEINSGSIKKARNFLKGKKGIKVIKGMGEILKFNDESFDVVILFDVIEHVEDPEKMIIECIRVLKPGGILYCEFTPYYSLVGHHLYDITKLPIHILPKKYIKKIVYNKSIAGIFNPKEYWDDFKTLNKLKISEFQKYTENLSKIDEKYILKYPDIFEINIPLLAHLGRFKDLLTFSFEGIYTKPQINFAWEQRAKKYKRDIRGVLFKKPYPEWVNTSFHFWSMGEVKKIVENDKRFKILDIACGWGRVSKQILKNYSKVRLIGIDISKTFVDIYNKDLAPRGKAKEASMETLPFKNNEFDAAFLIVSLMYLPTKEQQLKALNEIFRVIKNKGKFVLIERTPLMGFFDISRKFKKHSSKQISFTPGQIRGLIDSVEGKILNKSYWPFKFLPLYISYIITK